MNAQHRGTALWVHFQHFIIVQMLKSLKEGYAGNNSAELDVTKNAE